MCMASLYSLEILVNMLHKIHAKRRIFSCHITQAVGISFYFSIHSCWIFVCLAIYWLGHLLFCHSYIRRIETISPLFAEYILACSVLKQEKAFHFLCRFFSYSWSLTFKNHFVWKENYRRSFEQTKLQTSKQFGIEVFFAVFKKFQDVWLKKCWATLPHSLSS